jgi:hypothetical protein
LRSLIGLAVVFIALTSSWQGGHLSVRFPLLPFRPKLTFSRQPSKLGGMGVGGLLVVSSLAIILAVVPRPYIQALAALHRLFRTSLFLLRKLSCVLSQGSGDLID